MALVYVAGFTGTGADRNMNQQAAPKMPPVFEDVLDTTSGEDHTAVLPDSVTLVRVHSEGAIHLSIMPGAVAATSAAQHAVPMVADQTEYFTVTPQDACRVSAILQA